jgi:hypothetical protein
MVIRIRGSMRAGLMDHDSLYMLIAGKTFVVVAFAVVFFLYS